jgi:putative transposase
LENGGKNDNPFSEAQFKTLKYRLYFPGRFTSIEPARAHGREFFRWYNDEHRHGGLGLHAAAVQDARVDVLAAACLAHPSASSARPPHRPPCPAHPGSTRPRKKKQLCSKTHT